MRRTQLFSAMWLALLGALVLTLAPAPGAAQDDLRGIIPYIMLVVDTSGSMERQAECLCTTPNCNECLPNCNLPNVDPENPPKEKVNRWAMTLDALTGRFVDFECSPIARTSENLGNNAYDLDYMFPYHQPWKCPGGIPGRPCPYSPTTAPQEANGILDLNISGVRFGLMTFDGVSSYGREQQLTEAQFDNSRSEGIEGLWSYGGKKPYRFPNCDNTYFMDTGARSAAATEGALISLESCSGPGPLGTPGCEAWCTACPATQETVNRDIQEALLVTRPYGSTPIAAALDDLYYHFDEDLTDVFGACRNRYAILITDGRPDADYRNAGCDCFEDGDGSDCGGPPNDPTQMRCPYPLPEVAAQNLVEGRNGQPPMLRRLFVVGLALEDDVETKARLERIADLGCNDTPEACAVDDEGNQLIEAKNREDLIKAVQIIVEESSEPVSRTVPVFVSTGLPEEPQYMFNTGLQLPTQANEPWKGILERRRYVCSGTQQITADGFAELSASHNDFFHRELNDQAGRVLYTATPPGTLTPLLASALDGVLVNQTGNVCGVSGCVRREISSGSLGQWQIVFGTTDPTHTREIIDWMKAETGTPRENAALGAIYHSTPAVLSAPRFDLTDDDFNEWRRTKAIEGRPQILFVATIDGMLHAISTGNFAPPEGVSGWRNLTAGEELWGFVPPMLLNDLKDNPTAPQGLLDTSPVLKTVNVDRSKGPAGYRTILIMGMGMNELNRGYFGLDVTDPFDPKFLWQFTSPSLGRTVAQPTIVQAKFNRQGTVKEGAVAILPGGMGRTQAGGLACNGGTTRSFRMASDAPFETLVPPKPPGPGDPGGGVTPTVAEAIHRFDVRCWAPDGRSLYFLDAEDGFLLKEIHLQQPGQDLSENNKPFFPSPLVSTPAAFPDEPGTPTSRVFVTDADGVIWRIDLRSLDPMPDRPLDGWTARPFHDVFWDTGFAGGELSYEAPILSTDAQGRPVVIVGTGDTFNFVKPNVRNRIVSLTEVETEEDIGSPLHFQAQINWELLTKDGVADTHFTDGVSAQVDGFAESELVTGSMGLFEGQLFAGTFIAVANSANVCDLGRGRLFVLDYVRPDYEDENLAQGGSTGTSRPKTYGPMRINAADPDDDPGESIVNILRTNPAGDNIKISGLSLVQVPSCTLTSAAFEDPWGTPWAGITSEQPPQLQVKAHAANDRSDQRNLVQQRDGSRLPTLEMNVRPPPRFTRIMSWAAAVD